MIKYFIFNIILCMCLSSAQAADLYFGSLNGLGLGKNFLVNGTDLFSNSSARGMDVGVLSDQAIYESLNFRIDVSMLYNSPTDFNNNTLNAIAYSERQTTFSGLVCTNKETSILFCGLAGLRHEEYKIIISGQENSEFKTVSPHVGLATKINIYQKLSLYAKYTYAAQLDKSRVKSDSSQTIFIGLSYNFSIGK